MKPSSPEKPTPLAIVAACDWEVAPFLKTLKRLQSSPLLKGRLHQGSYQNCEITLLETGVGQKRMRQVLEEFLEHWNPQNLLLAGVCGGVSSQLRSGDTLLPVKVCDMRRETLFAASEWIPRKLIEQMIPKIYTGGILASADRMLGLKDKQLLAQSSPDIQAVDMEALAFARCAAERGIPWAVIKTVGDSAEMRLPDSALMPLIARKIPLKTQLIHSVRHPVELYRLMRLNQALRDAASINAQQTLLLMTRHLSESSLLQP